ncbi:MAG: O-antigen ligase domain-containing protein [Myxococcales bacterium]|nr:O-antigen ligase domain-containing protein [Myxococcales bacterium]
MSDPLSRRRTDFGTDPARQLLIPALVALPLAGALALGGPAMMAAVGIVGLGAGTFLANPRVFILVFLTLISMRNFVAGGERIDTGGGIDFDLGGLVNVLASGVGLVYFLVLWKNPFKGRSLTTPYGIFLALFAVSIAWAPDFHWAVRFVTRLAAPFFTYLIISDMLDSRMERQLIRALYASSVVPILFGYYQWFTGTGNDVTEGYNRVNSSFFHPAHFGMYLDFMFCLSYSELLSPTVRQKSWRVIYIVLITLLQIATYTRITWACMLFAFLYLSWVYNKRSYILGGLVLGTFFILGFGQGIESRVTSVTDAFGSSDVYDLNTSVGWRLYFWDEILKRCWEHPWLGFGAGSSVMLGVELFGVEAAPHNGYLRVLYETGFIGLGAFLYVLFTMLYQGFRLIRGSRDTRVTFISHIYVSMTVIYLLLNSTDNILEYYEVDIYQWAMLSLVEFANLRAARLGMIAQARFEEDLEVDDDDLEQFKGGLDEVDGVGDQPDPVAPAS